MGLLVEISNNTYRTLIGELIRALNDPRKDARISRYRLLGARLEKCVLPVSEPTIEQNYVIKVLASYNLAQWPAYWYSKYYPEQVEAIKQIIDMLSSNDSGPVLMALPTGSGKTEGFTIPALAHASNAIGSGVKSIFVYPRLALETDQLRRLVGLYIRLIIEHKIDGTKLPRIVIRDRHSVRRIRPNTEFNRFKAVELPRLSDGKECKVELYYRVDGWLKAKYQCSNGKKGQKRRFLPL